MPPKANTKAKAKGKAAPKAKTRANPKAAIKAVVKAKAKATPRRARVVRFSSRKKPASKFIERTPTVAGGAPVDTEASPVLSSWASLLEGRLERGKEYHLEGRYLGAAAEVTGRVEALIEDSLGKWAQFTLNGTSNEALREWRLKEKDLFYVSTEEVPTDRQHLNNELFYSQRVKGVAEGLAWGRNLIQEEKSGLPGIQELAQELGYGVGEARKEPERPAPSCPSAPVKKRKLKGKERVAAMLQQAKWSWKGTSLDPKFKKPKLPRNRKKDSTSSSSTSTEKASKGSEDQEDLFPEEDQVKQIHRKCPGLLTRHSIQQAKERVLMLQGEGNQSNDPEPVFVRYHHQVFLQSQPNAPLKWEHLTLANALDALVRGDILKAGDIMCQRLKSLEQIAQGSPAHLAMKLEVLPTEKLSLASSQEAKTAAAEHHRELKLTNTWKGKGKPNSWNPNPWQTVPAPKGPRPKGGTKGDQKGEKGNKGERVGKSQVVAPSS